MKSQSLTDELELLTEDKEVKDLTNNFINEIKNLINSAFIKIYKIFKNVNTLYSQLNGSQYKLLIKKR